MKFIHLLMPAALVLSSACAPLREYPPDEVLQRSLKAQQELRSARFTATAIATGTAALLTQLMMVELDMEGVLADRGKSVDAHVTVAVKEAIDSSKKWNAEANVIRADGATYVRIERTSGESDIPFLQSVGILAGKWYAIPLADNQNFPTITPDPSILSVQLESVEIIKNYGIVEKNGEKMYHFDTQLNPDSWKTLQLENADETLEAHGTLFIDAQNFHLRSAAWQITTRNGKFPSKLDFTFDISGFNETTSIIPPRNAAPLNLTMFMPATTLLQPTF